jgi:hypothetical protein
MINTRRIPSVVETGQVGKGQLKSFQSDFKKEKWSGRHLISPHIS